MFFLKTKMGSIPEQALRQLNRVKTFCVCIIYDEEYFSQNTEFKTIIGKFNQRLKKLNELLLDLVPEEQLLEQMKISPLLNILQETNYGPEIDTLNSLYDTLSDILSVFIEKNFQGFRILKEERFKETSYIILDLSRQLAKIYYKLIKFK